MTDNFEHALEKEVQRLTRERDEARQECLNAIADRNDWHFREEMARRELDEERHMRLIHEEAAAGARKDHAEVVERLRVAEAERNEACRALTLERQVSAAHRDTADDLRRRLEATENDRTEWQRVGSEWKARAENAEQERDLAVRNFDTCERLRAEWKARAEAAEADNAALRKVIAAVTVDAPGRVARVLEEHKPIITADHPGAALLEERDNWKRMHEANVEAGARVAAEFDKAGVGRSGDGVLTRALALLERLRAAEKVVEAARGNGGGYEDSWAVLSEALAAYDAAKEGV